MLTHPSPTSTLQAKQVYTLAALCLMVGLAIGYLVHPSQLVTPAAVTARPAPNLPPGHPTGGPTLDQLRSAAERNAQPLLERLKKEPGNTGLLVQIGGAYHGAHQFSDAALYYGKAVEAEPRNVGFRVKLASSLYRSGDVTRAIAELNRALEIAPNDANALFDLGMMKLEGTNDRAGALAAWRLLLKSNPQLSGEKKAVVESMIARAQSATATNGSAAQ